MVSTNNNALRPVAATTRVLNVHEQAAAERLAGRQPTDRKSLRRNLVAKCMIGLAAAGVVARMTTHFGSHAHRGSATGHPVGDAVAVAVIGAAAGAFFSHRMRRFRKGLALLGLTVVAGTFLIAPEPVDLPAWFVIGAVPAWLMLRIFAPAVAKGEDDEPTTMGSSRWANLARVLDRGLIGEAGFLLGWFYDGLKRFPIHYAGTRHLLTVGPNGSGKGVAAIIPNLLHYRGSVVAIDVKGELAAITAAARRKLGQRVFILDPWGIVPGETSARYNPIDFLRPDDIDLNEKSMMMADALVVHEGGGDSFWDEEAKSLLNGLILYVVLSPNFEGERTLGTVRDLMNAPADTFNTIMEDMSHSPNAIVSSTAARTMAKTEKLRANVLTTLQAQTHFLDSPRLRENMSRSDYSVGELKNTPTTLYLVLPADRLDTFKRWVRLHIQVTLTAAAQDIQNKPERPMLFLIDEMAALGRLSMVETAFGLLSGFGVVIWGVLQDLSQLERIYEKGYETFISNAGVLQYFGSRDEKTASYFSKLCGVATVTKWSVTRAISRALGISRSTSGSGGSSSSSSGWSHTTTTSDSVAEDVVQRSLAYPDELMVMRRDQSLLLVENNYPISAGKITWYTDDRFKHLGVDLKGRATPAGQAAENGAAKLPRTVRKGEPTASRAAASV